MIDLYTYRTSNGRKVSIMLEELALPYELHVVDITKGAQHAPAFRAISPNGRIPAIVDRDGPGGAPYALFESGAILMYLAEKCGRLMPREVAARYRVIEWLMFQMGGVGPMFGQAFHFLHQTADDAPAAAITYGRARYGAELRRLCAVLEDRLAGRDYLAGDYSIADIATYPWIAIHRWFDLTLTDTPALARWYARIHARPAVRRGMRVPPRG
jgi:GSH-dependent disulfide-bond oxidoreductase